MSHTTDNMVIGVTRDVAIGTDIESGSRQLRQMNALPKKYMTIAEQRSIKEKVEESEELGRKQFLLLWTRKEAYAKATGRGISTSLFKSFDATVGLVRNDEQDDHVSIRPYTLNSYDLEDGSVTSTCVLGPTPKTTSFFNLSSQHY